MSTHVAKKLWKLINIIDNNGLHNFEKNGERNFLEFALDNFDGENFTFFDVGANVGEYTEEVIAASNQRGVLTEAHLFEPTKSCFEKLLKLFKNTRGVKLNNFGLSNQTKNAVIFYDRANSGFASLYKRDGIGAGIKLNKKESISLKTSSEYILRNRIKHITLLKLDVEGHEISVLEGFKNKLNSSFIDLIQFEYGGCNLDSRTYLKDFFELLEERGFILAKIMPKSLVVRDYELYMENFVYSNYVAISKKSNYFKLLNK